MKHCLLLPLLIFVSAACPSMVLADNVMLTEITFTINEADEGREAVHIDMNLLRHPVVLGLQGENPRVVLDFIKVETMDTIKKTIEVNGRFIKRIRIGKHEAPETKTRVVLDLVPAGDYTIQHLPSVEKKRFSVIISPRSKITSTSLEE